MCVVVRVGYVYVKHWLVRDGIKYGRKKRQQAVGKVKKERKEEEEEGKKIRQRGAHTTCNLHTHNWAAQWRLSIRLSSTAKPQKSGGLYSRAHTHKYTLGTSSIPTLICIERKCCFVSLQCRNSMRLWALFRVLARITCRTAARQFSLSLLFSCSCSWKEGWKKKHSI